MKNNGNSLKIPLFDLNALPTENHWDLKNYITDPRNVTTAVFVPESIVSERNIPEKHFSQIISVHGVQNYPYSIFIANTADLGRRTEIYAKYLLAIGGKMFVAWISRESGDVGHAIYPVGDHHFIYAPVATGKEAYHEWHEMVRGNVFAILKWEITENDKYYHFG